QLQIGCIKCYPYRPKHEIQNNLLEDLFSFQNLTKLVMLMNKNLQTYNHKTYRNIPVFEVSLLRDPQFHECVDQLSYLQINSLVLKSFGYVLLTIQNPRWLFDCCF